MTKTSSFLAFLVKICFISIVRTEKKNKFSLIKLFVYIAISIGFFVLNTIIFYEIEAIKDEDNENHDTIQVYYIRINLKSMQKRYCGLFHKSFLKAASTVDFLSMIATIWTQIIAILLPVVLRYLLQFKIFS